MTLKEKMKAYPTIIYDRVVGWYSAKNSMNKGKIAEKNQMKRYKLKD